MADEEKELSEIEKKRLERAALEQHDNADHIDDTTEEGEEEEEEEAEYMYGFGVVAVKGGQGFMFKDISDSYTFERECTQIDMVVALSYILKKLENQEIAGEVVNLIRSTPGKTLVGKRGRLH